MLDTAFWQAYGEAAKTALGFFWKSGWAFVLGYWVSAMIQAFVPKSRLTRYIQQVGLDGVSEGPRHERGVGRGAVVPPAFQLSEVRSRAAARQGAFARPIGLWLMPCVVLLLQAWRTPPPVSPEDLQGCWEGSGSAGRISIRITGNSLHFFARTDFWYDATIVLPAGMGQQQLHATITDSSPPTDNIGAVVFALVKIEEGTLSLAVDDGSDRAPATFDEAASRYDLRRARPPGEKSEAG